MNYELVNSNHYGEWNLEYLRVNDDGTGLVEVPRLNGIGMASSKVVENARTYMDAKVASIAEDGYSVRWALAS